MRKLMLAGVLLCAAGCSDELSKYPVNPGLIGQSAYDVQAQRPIQVVEADELETTGTFRRYKEPLSGIFLHAEYHFHDKRGLGLITMPIQPMMKSKVEEVLTKRYGEVQEDNRGPYWHAGNAILRLTENYGDWELEISEI